MTFAIVFLVAAVSAVLLTPLVRAAAMSSGVLDQPGAARKIHRIPVPLLGGVAVSVAMFTAVCTAIRAGDIPDSSIKAKYLVGLGIAGLLLIVGGALDDRFDLRPSRQIVWPALAALVIVASGIGVDVVTSPLGGIVHLDRFVVPVLTFRGIPYKATLLADLFTFVWLMGTTYTTKLLDGLDGLVSGIVVIGGVIVALVSLTRDVAQPDTALLALALAGAFLGFLVYNYHPASIFLGEGGSTFAGFMLGTLAIISGGKIATTLLILGLPLFDAALVLGRRLLAKRSLIRADRTHLHQRLLDMGLTHRQAVLLYWLISAFFGSATLLLHGWEKVAALIALLFLFAVSSAVRSSRRT